MTCRKRGYNIFIVSALSVQLSLPWLCKNIKDGDLYVEGLKLLGNGSFNVSWYRMKFVFEVFHVAAE